MSYRFQPKHVININTFLKVKDHSLLKSSAKDIYIKDYLRSTYLIITKDQRKVVRWLI